MLRYSSALVLTLALSNGALAGLTNSASPVTWRSGSFEVRWTGNQLSVLSRTEPGKVLWQSVPGEAFAVAGGHALEGEDNRGSYTIDERVRYRCEQQQVTGTRISGNTLKLTGRYLDSDSRCRNRTWSFRFRALSAGQLRFDWSHNAGNYSELRFASRADERFYGFGEQFSVLNHKGHEVPVIAQENGVGRTHPVIAPVINLASPGSAGHAYSTYAAMPQFVSSLNRGLVLENDVYSVFDLRENDRVRIRLFEGRMAGRILQGRRMLDVISALTEYTGRMPELPAWIQQGAIVGMQGGTQRVLDIWEKLRAHNTPIAAFWLQDWVGKRKTAIGSQLWWNWELDEHQYPEWSLMVDTLNDAGIRVMGYINSMMVDASLKGQHQRNLYQEALARGYLVKKPDGSPYPITNTDFDAGLLDLSNPAARRWYKDIIRDNLIGSGLSGWMADFAEALPFDAVLYNGQTGAAYHNRYAEEWARLNREALEETGRLGDIVFFNRAGFTRSTRYSTLFWEGDQTVTWDEHDGFRSALLALINGGFSGITLNHSDIGGYTSLSKWGLGYSREKELLLRWMEANAFTAAFRTHEGNQPEENAQFYSDNDTLNAFARWARVYAALAPYRSQFIREAANKGYPLVRHPMLHDPDDAELAGLKDHFLLGSDILVAPIVNKQRTWKKVYFPAGTWINVWTGKAYGDAGKPTQPWWNRFNPANGRWAWVPAPLNQPPVFIRADSPWRNQVISALRRAWKG